MKSIVAVGAALLAGCASGAESPRPRGVGPEFAKFYKSTDAFTCISNPAITIPFSQINDNYCDCPDGSDEPGTSACAYLSPLSAQFPSTHGPVEGNVSVALPGFYCKNKGHNPSYVPFTYVNDGICDYDLCCDGSDEWSGVGGTKCPDKCQEIGVEWRKQDEKRQISLTTAAKRRKELVAEGAKLRLEVEDHIKAYQNTVAGLEIKIAQLEQEKAEVEERERNRVVKSGQGGKVGVLASLAKDKIGELVEGLAGVRTQRDALQSRLTELESIMTTFREEYNPNFNDEGVKRAVRSWEEYIARDKPEDVASTNEQDLDEMQKGVESIDWAEFETSDNDVVDDDVAVCKSSASFTRLASLIVNTVYQYQAYLPKSLSDWLSQKLGELRTLLVDNGILAAKRSDPTGPATENKATQEAQQRLSTAQSELADTNRKLQAEQEDLAKDYGVDDVFRSLKGQCITLDSGEYTYELCWLDRVTQRSKKGGASNGMGNFARFDAITVDEPLPADGRGLGSGERVAMRYEGGQHCWNGPARSTTVVLACAEREEIWKVAEEEKCVYRMDVGTPAVCDAPRLSAKGAEPAKDEL